MARRRQEAESRNRPRERKQSSNDDDRGKKLSIVIFGASGDLTSRKIIPALYALQLEKLLPKSYRVIGVGRSDLGDEEFRQKVEKGVEKYARISPKDSSKWNQFARHLSYLQGDYNDQDTYSRLKERVIVDGGEKDRVLFYASTPPSVDPRIVEGLGKAGFGYNSAAESALPNSNVSIIIEKPFGADLKTARSLDKHLHSVFKESQVYRIDHYLGKETVQNILTFRFANAIFEPLWNRSYIDHIQVTVAESVGVEHRAGYYEKAGVARDMLQNHLMQLVALCAMDPPVRFNEKELRDEKAKVIRSLRIGDPAEDCVWGQYEGYTEEEGVASNSRTPTFIALKLYVNNWRWQGVPFFLRTGKKLRSKVSEIVIQFKRVPLLLFPEDSDIRPNRIAVCIQPDEGLHLRFETKRPGMGMRTTPVDMEFEYKSLGKRSLPGAYEHLMLDAMKGDPSLFTRADAIEQAWKFVDPIVKALEERKSTKLHYYKTSTWGPKEADELIGRHGSSWYVDCVEEHG